MTRTQQSPKPTKSQPQTRFSRLTMLLLVLGGVVLSVAACWWFFGLQLTSGQLAVVAGASAVVLACVGQAIRYRFRISLRTGLIVVAVLAAVFAFAGRRIMDARRESSALDQLVARGNLVKYHQASRIFARPPQGYFRSPDGTAYPNWLRDVLGLTYFNPPKEIGLRRADDAQLALLSSVRQAELLTLSSPDITADGVAQMPVVPQVQTIALVWDQVTPQSVERLRQYTSMTTLTVELRRDFNQGKALAPLLAPVDASPQRESHARYLTGLTQLTMLNTRVDHFDAADGAALASLPQLDMLNLQTPSRRQHGLLVLALWGGSHLARRTETTIDDEFLAQIVDHCDGEPANISGLPELAKSQAIRRLGLSMQEFTDNDLLTLMEMPNLESVTLRFSQVTAAGVREAKQLRPDVGIFVEPLPWGLEREEYSQR